MATELMGSFRWGGGDIDADGHRTWMVVAQVKGSLADGPAQAVLTPGLPLPGDVYAFGNDIDIWAWCREGPVSIQPQRTDGGNIFWYLTYTYSTRPPDATGPGGGTGGRDDKGARKKCADQRIEDPLSEPPAVSGNSIRYTEEATEDAEGKPLRYTSFERIRGPAVEFDKHRELIVIEQNVVNLERGLILSMVGKLNDAALWDMPARCWKLADWSWQRKLYGLCSFYFTRRLVYESNAEEVDPASPKGLKFQEHLLEGPDGRWWLSGWDRNVLDESNRVLNGHWHWFSGAWILDNINGAPPDPNNPRHYITARDRDQNPIRMILSASEPGQPMNYTAPPDEDEDANFIHIEKYGEANHLTLGIPVTL